MPNLILRSGKPFKVHKTALNPYYGTWTEYKIESIEEGQTIKSGEFFLDIVNIGIGTAKDVEVEFIINKKQVENFLMEKGFVFERFDMEGDVIGFQGNAPNIEHPFGSNTMRNEIEFIIEYISNDKNGVPLKLPLIYLYTFTTYTALYSGDLARLIDHYEYFPPLIFKMKYSDIANKKYKRKFEISLNVTGVTISENLDNIQGTFDVKQL